MPGSTSATIEALHVGAAALLASFPWLCGFRYLEPTNATWLPWIGALGAHALLLLAWPARTRLVPALSLLALLGLCFIQGSFIAWRIVMNALNRDYYLLAAWLHSASRNLFEIPPTFPTTFRVSYFQLYFDPVIPLLNAVVRLSDDPFRLLGFHVLAIVLAPLIAWWICVSVAPLRSFQLLVPSALLLHPSVVGPMQLDYHTSSIGFAPLLVGSYAFWLNRHRSAFLFLLLGTLTKVSFWPSWLMFGVVHAVRRRWAWALTYVALGLTALLVYPAIQLERQQSLPGTQLALAYLGRSIVEIATNILVRPDLWIGLALQPLRWHFFVMMLLPLGFVVVRYPRALVPIAPLAVLSLIDATAWRTLAFNSYAIEYLGFLAAGSLLALREAGRRARALAAVAIAGGVFVTIVNPYLLFDRLPGPTISPRPAMHEAVAALAVEGDRYRAAMYIQHHWMPKFSEVMSMTAGYDREVAFAACAIGDAPAIATNYSWAALVRGHWDQVWIEQLGYAFVPEILATAETLVSPARPTVIGTLANFPERLHDQHIAEYAMLFDRLPMTVTTGYPPFQWQYFGGERLAACAGRFGYSVAPHTFGSHQLRP